LIYRTDVLATLGQSVPTTWDELLSVGRAIRDRTGMAAFGVAGNAAHYVLPMVWQNGGEIAYRKGGVWRSGMDSPEAVAAVQFYADLYRTERFAPAGALSWNARDVRKAFEAGDLAMMIGGAWDVRALLSAHPELAGKVGTALLPAGPTGDRDSFAGGSHLVTFAGSKKEALARRYLDFLLAPARVTAFTTKIGFLPGARATLAATTPDSLYQPFSAQLEDHSRTYPPTREWGSFEADGLFTAAIQQVMAGKRTAGQAMKDVAKAMDAAFDG
jgi:N,N'-diacetylchitobiose transport system substrate-binding protein